MALAFACAGAAAPLPSVTIFADIAAGTDSSNPAGFFTVNGKLLFSAGGADYGLWSSDGTPAGTLPILPGGAGLLGTAGGTGYLTRLNYSTCTTELWKTDGTAAGTTEVTDLGMGFAGPAAALAGKLYFGFFHAAATNSDCNSFTTTTGTQLLRTDGTGPGTVLVKDWDPLYGGQINELFSDGSTLYIGGGFVDDAELWKSDGTDTTLVKDINPIVVSGLYPQGSYPHNFVSLAGTVYFVAYDGNDYQLWKTDGTEAGTSLAVGLSGGIGRFWSAGGRLFFDGSDGSQFGAWASDGTQANTHFLGDVALGYGPPVALGGTVYFLGDQAGVAGLWKTDGTAAGTTLIKAIATPQPHGARAPGELTVAGSRLFFAADDGTHGE